MGSSQYSGPDVFLYPVEITPNNNNIVFKEAPGTGSETSVDYNITEGIWWIHLSNDNDFRNEYQSVLLDIQEAINNDGNIGGTYKFRELDKSGSDLGFSSLRLDQDNDPDGEDFQIDFANSTIPPEILGFKPDRTSAITDSSSISGTVSVYGKWQSPVTASNKTRSWNAQVMRSNTGGNAEINTWKPDTQTRMIKYHQVAGAHVYKYKAEDSSLASDAGLIQDDVNNGLEDLWRGLRIGDVLAIYNNGDDSNSLKPKSFSDETEPLSINESSNRQFREWISNEPNYAGEFYDIQFEAVIEDSSEIGPYRH